MSLPLQGRKVALAEGRQLEELAQLLEKEGAVALRYPMVSILDAPEPAPVRAWLEELIAGRFGLVVLMTGEALRRLLGFAERWGLREQAIAAFGRTRTVTRGPKPVKALKEVGLTPTRIAEAPTTEGVIVTLQLEPLQGVTVGVTLYGVPNPTLVQFLETAGAIVRTVLPYVLAPGSDGQRVVELIERLASGEVDVLVFTSSAQIDRLHEVARVNNLEAKLTEGLGHVVVAAVGPVLADHLKQMGRAPDICPEQGFVMKNLVQCIKREMQGRRPQGS